MEHQSRRWGKKQYQNNPGEQNGQTLIALASEELSPRHPQE